MKTHRSKGEFSMAEITLKDIHKYYGANHVLKGIDLEIFEGNSVGLIGKNGAGKTTLFKVLTGEEPFEKGELFLSRGKRVGILDQIPEYPEDYTVIQVLDTAFEALHAIKRNIDAMACELASNDDPILVKKYGTLVSEYEARGGYTTDTALKRVCMGLGLDEAMQQRPFCKLSGGEKTRVNLARIILTDTHILLLDEPTNHLDIQAVEWLEEYLDGYDGTVVIISHDRYFLDRVAERIIEIEDGKAFSYEGNYSFYVMLKEQRRLEQLARFEQEQKKIKQLEDAIKRMHDWAQRADSKKMHRRAFSMEKRLGWMVRDSVDKPRSDRKMASRFKQEQFSSTEALVLKGIEMVFGDKKLLNGIGLLVKKEDRMALLGKNGAGKTTLLKIIIGELTADSGIVKIGPSVKMAYLPQHVHFDEPNLSVMDTIRYELIVDEGRARNLLAGYMFTGEDVFKTVGVLSGGERSRLKLCLLMQKGVNFLILDEPTNHLDIASREWIEEALDGFDGTILFVSHDRYFIRKFATSISEIEDGKLVCFDGNYETFRDYKRVVEEEKRFKEREQEKLAALLKEKPKVNTKNNSPKALERRLAKIESDIAICEGRQSSLEADLEVYASDYVRLGQLLEEKNALSAKLEALYQEWDDVQGQIN